MATERLHQAICGAVVDQRPPPGTRLREEELAQLRQLRCTQFAGQAAHDLALDDTPCVEDVFAVAPRRLGHLRAAVVAQGDDTVLRQLVQRLAHDGARHREGLRQFSGARRRPRWGAT